MGKLCKAFAAASLVALTSCVSTPVPSGQPGHRPRPLTTGEVDMAKRIFGNQINYSAISVYSHSGQKNKGFHGRLQMASHSYTEDYSKTGNSRAQAIFIHELAHIWQEQRGVNVIGSAIGEWLKHGGKYDRAYRYTLTPNMNFAALGIEQQASIIEHYWLAVNELTASNRNYRCGEILRYETVLKPYFPAIKTPDRCR